jgi:hypothetical protein
LAVVAAIPLLNEGEIMSYRPFDIVSLDVRTASENALAPLVAHENRMQLERLPDDPPVPLAERIAGWRNSPAFLDLGCWIVRDGDKIIANAWTEIWHTAANEHVLFFNILVQRERSSE